MVVGQGAVHYCAELVSCNEISEIICPITRRWVARGLLMVSLCPALPVHCIFDKNLIPGGGERRGGGLSWGTGRDYHGTPRLVAWIALIKGTSTFSIEVPSPSDTTNIGQKSYNLKSVSSCKYGLIQSCQRTHIDNQADVKSMSGDPMSIPGVWETHN